MSITTKIKIVYEKTRDSFWQNVFEQEKKYGNVSIPEPSWGKDVGYEIIE